MVSGVHLQARGGVANTKGQRMVVRNIMGWCFFALRALEVWYSTMKPVIA